jgi:hypothetical protein
VIDLFSEEIHIAVNRLSQIKKIRARLRKKCVVWLWIENTMRQSLRVAVCVIFLWAVEEQYENSIFR